MCPLSELPPGTMRGIEQDGKRILIVNLEARIHAWDGTCTHEEADLSTGFLHPAVKRIPLRSVRAVIQFLIDEKWAGRGGMIPPRVEQLPEFEEEPEKEAVEADLFERHYKYR